jgi:hypothetical protein
MATVDVSCEENREWTQPPFLRAQQMFVVKMGKSGLVPTLCVARIDAERREKPGSHAERGNQ